MKGEKGGLETAMRRWRADPASFVTEVLHDPETARPFVLYDAQRRFLREALTLTHEGRLPYPELVYSCPKKSGKTATAGMAALYVMTVLGVKFGECYALANDYDQAQGRVYQAIARIIQASPLLASTAKVATSKIEFLATGATIQALASDYASAAGGNPTLSIFDELWGYQSERGRRLWDEMAVPPTRAIAARLTVSYAGFENDSELLEAVYKRGLTGAQIAPDLYAIPGQLLMFWSHTPVAPWQTRAWLEQMRNTPGQRTSTYLRLYENRWVANESSFIEPAWWTACEQIDPAARMVLADPTLRVWVGIDASVKRDSTALVACAWDAATKRVRMIWHRIFQPTPADPIDFESVIEGTVLELATRFALVEVRYDPFQMVASAQRLTAAGIPMLEFPQSTPNLTEASSNLYECIKSANLIAYADDAVRLAISRAIAVESGRGWRISKEKASHKIDVVVALAQAALGVTKGEHESVPPQAIGLAPQAYTPTNWDDGPRW